MTTVHRITLVIVDHDDMDEESIISALGYGLDASLTPVSHESQEIEWEDDDNPFNYKSEIPAAAAELFDDE